MLRGLPHLTHYAPHPVERRKLLPDPENEPDFYGISKLFPLPDDQTNQVEEARAALAKRGIFITNETPTTPVASNSISAATSLAQISSRGLDPTLLLPLDDLSSSTLSAVAAARLSVAARMQELDSNLNRTSNTNLSLYSELSNIDQLPTIGLNSYALRERYLQSNTFYPSILNYQNDTPYETLRSPLDLSQVLADQQSHDRIAAYLQYLNPQGNGGKSISSTMNPFGPR